MKRECETCIKRKTTYCPNSIECMDTNDMPYYQNRIMLLEENKQLKSILVELEEWLKETRINSAFIDEQTIIEVQLKIQELKEKYK